MSYNHQQQLAAAAAAEAAAVAGADLCRSSSSPQQETEGSPGLLLSPLDASSVSFSLLPFSSSGLGAPAGGGPQLFSDRGALPEVLRRFDFAQRCSACSKPLPSCRCSSSSGSSSGSSSTTSSSKITLGGVAAAKIRREQQQQQQASLLRAVLRCCVGQQLRCLLNSGWWAEGTLQSLRVSRVWSSSSSSSSSMRRGRGRPKQALLLLQFSPIVLQRNSSRRPLYRSVSLSSACLRVSAVCLLFPSSSSSNSSSGDITLRATRAAANAIKNAVFDSAASLGSGTRAPKGAPYAG